MQIKQLQHFLAALDCGSITQAATQQNVTQPTLSRSIRALELRLKVELLDRTRSGVAPTATGRAFAEYARGIVTGMDHATKEVEAMRTGRLGHVRIGLGALALQPVTARAIAGLSQGREDLTITIRHGIVEDQLAYLRRAELDFVVDLRQAGMDATGLSFQPIAKTVIIVAAGRDHPLAKKPYATLAEMSDMPWVIQDQPMAENYYRMVLGLQSDTNNVRIRSNSSAMVRMLAQEGQFLILASRSEISDLLSSGQLVEINGDIKPFEREIHIITRKNAYISGAVRLVVDEICEKFAEIT